MKKSTQPAKMDTKHVSVNEVTPLKEPHVSHDIEEGEEEEREVSRLEMWTDALASIVATIAILPLMELLKEEESENSSDKPTRSESGGGKEVITKGEEVVQILKSMIFIGAGFYYIGLLLHHNCIAFHWITDTRSHLVYFLALVFMLFLSLSSFGTQSLVNGMINVDASAIYIWCVLFGLITGSALLLFIYCIYYTDLPHHVSKNVRLLECLILLSLVAGVGAVAIIISFDITYLSLTLPLSLVVPVMTLEIFTKKDKVNEVLLPKGYPKERLVLFADGVYAVAITLIVIDIRYTTSTSNAWEFLKDSWQSFVAHAIVFVIVGFHWYLHNVMFNYFQKADGHLFSINILHSALIALFPFCVKFMFVHDYGLYILAPVGCWALIAASQLLLVAVLKEWILSKRVPLIMALVGSVLVTLLTIWAILQ